MKARALRWLAAVLACVAFVGACSSSDDDNDGTTTTEEATTTTGDESRLTTKELCEELKEDVIEGVGGPDGFPTETAELEQLLTKLEDLQDQVPAELKTPMAIILLATQEFAAGTVPDMTTPTSTPSTTEFEDAGEEVQKWYDDNCEDESGGGGGGGGTTSTTRRGGGGGTTTTSTSSSTTSTTTASTTTAPTLPDPPTLPVEPVED